MDYVHFIAELNKGIEGRILAYDQCDDGCVLHLSDGGATVTVSRAAVDSQENEAIYALRERIRSSNWKSVHIALVLRDDALVFEQPNEMA